MPIVNVDHRAMGWERQSSTRIDSARKISGSGLEQPSEHISFVISGRVVRSRCAVMTMCGFPPRTAWTSSLGVDTLTCSVGPRSLMTAPSPPSCTWCCQSGRTGFRTPIYRIYWYIDGRLRINCASSGPVQVNVDVFAGGCRCLHVEVATLPVWV